MGAPVPPARTTRRTLLLALSISLCLLALRLDLAKTVGFGDAEALYVAYSLHPQPGYLDHPGLVGWIAGLLGSGIPVTPERLHVVTALLSTLLPWLGVLAARELGAETPYALRAFFPLALVPELAIGLFALTPDLPLGYCWLATLACAGRAQRAPRQSLASLVAYIGVGVGAAVACLSKASGALLALGVFLSMLRRAELARFRSLGPWAGLLLFGIVAQPLVRWEVEQGFPMFRHRLVNTQADAGFSLRNALQVIGGQLLYVTPPFLWGAYLLARELYRRLDADALDRLLQWTTAVTFVPLLIFCLYSRVAEPHWLAPALLGIALHLARSNVVRRWLARAALAVGILMAFAGWAWVRTTLPLALGDRLGGYEPKYDPSNDLYAWQVGGPLLSERVEQAHERTARRPVVVGPHWVVCAQAELALGGQVRVGCNSPIEDDYDRWLPRARWQSAPLVLFVTDSRFEFELPTAFADYEIVSKEDAEVRRGGRVVRTITVVELERNQDSAALAAPPLH
jgi:hypothetical protein